MPERILVIDDSPLIRTLVEDWLVAAGFVVDVAASGEQGLERVASGSPAAVLCDLSMPGLSGLEVVRRLKATQSKVPIIMFTESMELGDAVDAMKLGAFGYVNKGTAEHTVVNELRKAIDQRMMVERNAQLEEDAVRHQREHDRLREIEERQAELETLLEEKTVQISALQHARAHEDRLSAMGSIAAGIAHEVNNPLAVLKAGARYLADAVPAAIKSGDPESAAEIAQTLGELEECTLRIQKIIEAVKKLAQTPSTQSSCKPQEAMDEAWTSCRPKIPAGVEVEIDVEPAASSIALTRDDLALITSNLLLNAAQAFGPANPKGSVSIRVRSLEGAVILEVQDNGCGISAENLSQVCNPFFTTKPPGVGIGLGLSLVHQMVKNASGTMEIESTVGAGTQVRLRIPSEKAAVARSPAARS